MWVRGLKRFGRTVIVLRPQVAPHVGAWIETCLSILQFIR